VIHRFNYAEAGLLVADLSTFDGMLYGTMSSGGVSGGGQGGYVYSLDPAGSNYKIVHRFTKAREGGDPEAGLLSLEGTLYGTTAYGGNMKFYNCSGLGCGVVFSIAPPGGERTLKEFNSYLGVQPAADMIALQGTLYGTTTHGGGDSCYCQGSVFAVKVASEPDLELLYAFKGGKDGANPSASLIAVNGSFYGTTTYGGGNKCKCGTVFKLTPSKSAYKETILHAFAGGSDGATPYGGLVYLNGALYGTTNAGGGNCPHQGCGTVFRLPP
jgi:uncharacterized repeat protein (TIGR03803 family)